MTTFFGEDPVKSHGRKMSEIEQTAAKFALDKLSRAICVSDTRETQQVIAKALAGRIYSTTFESLSDGTQNSLILDARAVLSALRELSRQKNPILNSSIATTKENVEALNTILELGACARSFESDTNIVGNVSAGQIVNSLRVLLTALEDSQTKLSKASREYEELYKKFCIEETRSEDSARLYVETCASLRRERSRALEAEAALNALRKSTKA